MNTNQNPGLLKAPLGVVPGVKEAVQKALEPKQAASKDILEADAHAFSELTTALRHHGNAMRFLAEAIRGMHGVPAVQQPSAGRAKAAKKEPAKLTRLELAAIVESKVLDVVGKYPGHDAAAIHILTGQGGATKLEKDLVQSAMSRLASSGKVRREGKGGKHDPFRYFLPGSK